jgi:hypothetical protein
MGVSMYLVFSNKLARPTRRLHRLLLLIIAFLVYLFVGAYIHQTLNYDVDLEQQRQLIDYLNQFLDAHCNNSCLNESDIQYLYFLIDDVMDQGIKLSSSKLDNDTFTPNWLFGGETLFFTFTLLTTIGYGHLAPITKWGKIFCMAYIAVGVPLTLVLLQGLVTRIECCLMKKKADEAAEKQKRLLNQSSDSEDSSSSCEASSSSEIRTLTSPHKRSSTSVQNYLTLRLPNNDQSTQRAASEEHGIDCHYYKSLFLMLLTLTFFVYLLPAYVLSNYTEDKWSFLDSIYYIYVSVSTIGFGDFVPGTDQPGPYRNYYRLAITGK